MVHDGGFFDECITELQEQCVQDDVRLASYAAELARTVGTANAGDAYDVVSGPSLDHRDDVSGCVRHEDSRNKLSHPYRVWKEREFERVFHSQRESGAVTESPVELDSIESDALVAKGKLILCLKSIENSEGQIKARLVAMGNVLFGKHLSIRRDAALHDLWSLVASSAETRIVPARAAAYGRVTESIDLIAAYPQVVMGGEIKHYIIIPECLRRHATRGESVV